MDFKVKNYVIFGVGHVYVCYLVPLLLSMIFYTAVGLGFNAELWIQNIDRLIRIEYRAKNKKKQFTGLAT